MKTQTFNLPDVGEGLTEAEILSWKVAVGDSVAVNDILLEIETAKSVVELPSPYAGQVSQIHVPEGETVAVDTPLISISSPGQEPDQPQDSSRAAEADQTQQTAQNQEPALVGSGPIPEAVQRRPRKRSRPPIEQEDKNGPQTSSPTREEAALPREKRPLRQSLTTSLGEFTGKASALLEGGLRRLPASETSSSKPPRRQTLAKPPVRKAAQDMGIDLAQVPPTGQYGQVTKRDLLNYAAHARDNQQEEASNPDSFWIPKGVGGDRIERIKVRGVRKATAKATVQSAFSAPHVSIFVDVDASRTMEFVKRLKKSPHFEGIKVTPLLILSKAVIWATARNPQVNATWTEQEIQIKHFMNLGIAAATPRGLMVPNIKEAQDLSLRELAQALNELTIRAREGRTQPEEMAKGSISITNIGALGIDTGTPIINPGEVAIVAFGTIKQKPWVVDGEVIPRWVTTLGGSFDHRVVDGDLSARFMADVAAVMEEPALLLDD